MRERPVAWIAAGPEGRGRAKGLRRALSGKAQVLTLGPPGGPEPDLALPAGAGLDAALESCPPALRPSVCALSPDAPAGAEHLPCPVLGWGGAKGPEGALPAGEGPAAEVLLTAAGEPFAPAWMDAVQVNLPLADLLGRYRDIVTAHPLNFELGLDGKALDSLGPEDLGRAARLLRGRRLTAHLPFLDLKPGSLDPKVAAVAGRRLERAARWAVELGLSQAVAHTGFDARSEHDPEGFPCRLAEVMAPAARILAESGAAIALENTFEAGPELLLACREALAAQSGAEVGFCLDVGHVMCFSQTALEEWWRALGPMVIEMHLHDNDRASDRHWPAGAGEVDWDFLGRAIAKMDPKPVLTLEPHREADLWAGLRGLARVWGPPEAVLGAVAGR